MGERHNYCQNTLSTTTSIREAWLLSERSVWVLQSQFSMTFKSLPSFDWSSRTSHAVKRSSQNSRIFKPTQGLYEPSLLKDSVSPTQTSVSDLHLQKQPPGDLPVLDMLELWNLVELRKHNCVLVPFPWWGQMRQKTGRNPHRADLPSVSCFFILLFFIFSFFFSLQHNAFDQCHP